MTVPNLTGRHPSPTTDMSGPGTPEASAPGDARLWRAALIGLAVLGLAIRVAAVLARPHLKASGDALFYNEEANLLVAGKGWVNPLQVLAGHRGAPTAAFPPLFTLVLAAASLVGFKSFLAHRIWCAVIGAASVAVAGGTGRCVAGRRVGLLAAGVVAVYPNLWMSDDLAMSETLSPLLVLAVLWAAYALWRSPSLRRSALLGLLLGLATLGRDEMAVLAPLLIVPLAVGSRRSWRRRAALFAAAGGAGLLALAPWVGYNMTRFDTPVFVSDGLGVTLASANCDRTWYGADAGYWSMPCSAAVPYNPAADEAVQGAEAQRYAVHYIRTHLGGLPRIEAIRLGRAFGAYRPLQQINFDTFIEGRPHAWALTGLAMYYALVPMALAGGVVLRRRGVPVFPLVAVIADVAISVLLTFGQTRYRSIAEPVLALLAAVAVDGMLRRRNARRSPVPARVTATPGGRGVDTKDVLVVVPALNEEASVAGVVREIRAAVSDVTVLVVNDGSNDATAVLARAAGALVASSPFTLGVGGAMRIGFRYAQLRGFRVVVQVDADGQHDPADIPRLVAALGDWSGPSVVLGTRFGVSDHPKVSRPRRVAMRALARYVSRRTGVALDDVTSGFRAHNRAAIDLFARLYPAEYLSDTVESLVIAHDAGAVIGQVPVRMRERAGGSPSQNLLRAATYLVRVGFILGLARLRRGPATSSKEEPWPVSI
ncbi:glycosyltransferase family 2 protein [Acidiferrimicrobium sp. IK]|uniref:glycosyltransferase family 2 protein n=1 Tax=Acidiferrimicrobium sp. IK TaxID=2871700 RepID=UPI0021CB107E|nr:glycosyltransferase family 2 protein [Acidiferrimicrobium sp. IK]MCU4182923.1 glycosyltransferase family 2 protein [Acidiferrimicrobium sp. IK]